MLSYLILTTRATLMAAVLCGVIVGYTRTAAQKNQRRIVWLFALIGLIISIVVAILRNTTSLIDSAILNGWLYAISLTAFLLFLIFQLKPLARSQKKLISALPFIFLGLLIMTVIAYAFPDVWAYPHHVLLSEKTVISTDFLMAMIGMALGLILALVTFLAIEKSTQRLSENGALILLILELILNAALRASGLISVFFQKKIIRSNHLLFTYTVFVKNHSDWFLFLALVFAIAAAVSLWIRSFRQKEPYRNPAEHRLIRAKWRNIRRWAAVIVITAVLGILNLTVVEKINATDVTLSPIEDSTSVDDENVYVGFDLVSDGHLHRFAYTSENGVDIRFIVIKKPKLNLLGILINFCRKSTELF